MPNAHAILIRKPRMVRCSLFEVRCSWCSSSFNLQPSAFNLSKLEIDEVGPGEATEEEEHQYDAQVERAALPRPEVGDLEGVLPGTVQPFRGEHDQDQCEEPGMEELGGGGEGA